MKACSVCANTATAGCASSSAISTKRSAVTSKDASISCSSVKRAISRGISRKTPISQITPTDHSQPMALLP
ncbi:hypothetical protein D3C85_1828490 [compost metagenome]